MRAQGLKYREIAERIGDPHTQRREDCEGAGVTETELIAALVASVRRGDYAAASELARYLMTPDRKRAS